MEMALSGIRILGATRLLAGPYAETLLADMGAEVIRIELPVLGDGNRQAYPVINGTGTAFLATNRNKKSITLDLRTLEGQKIFKELVKQSDVVIENNRPGTMAKWNIGYEQLKEIKPSIIMASISAFGQTGLNSSRVGVDIVAQAAGGLMSLTGMPGGPPLRVGSAIGDFLAGMNTVYGILTALHYKEKTGLGQYVDCALSDSITAILENALQNYELLKIVPKRDGSHIVGVAPWNCYSAMDGYVVIGVSTDQLWARLVQVMGKVELLEDSRFESSSSRVENVETVDEIIQDWVEGKTVAEIVNMLADAGVPCSSVNDIAALFNDPQVMAREMLVETEYPGVGKFKVVGVVPKLSLTPGKVYLPVPTLGQHTEEVLKGLLNYSDKEIKTLYEKGVI
jgi:CoA:oxalate CoA-transferase